MTELATDSRMIELEQQVQQLTTALVTNRVTGAAVGLVMAHRNLDRAQAFAWLVAESQRTNTKLTAVALDLVARAEDAASGEGQEGARPDRAGESLPSARRYP